MPSDAFWTGLFTFAGGVVGGGAGYLTARLQQGLHRQQLTLEERKVESEESTLTQAQTERRSEAHRAIYLRYLTALDGVLNPVDNGTVDKGTLNRRFDLLLHAHCEVELAGGDEINQAAYELNDLLEALVAEVSSRLAEGRAGSDLTEPIRRQAEPIRAIRRRLVSLMGNDLDSIKPSGAQAFSG